MCLASQSIWFVLMEINLDFPEKLGFLFEPKRYKILYGGRGSAKSWSVAKALIALSMRSPIRVLCARELQNSISDSVIALLADQIKAMGVDDLFDVQRTAIYGKNGSEFSFVGLKHNVTSIKSFEGVDICWVEEGQAVSKASWETLIPTIRKPNSEIWVTFNPDLDTDETYKRFVVSPPNNAFVVKVNHSDNPWFPDVLKDELEQLKAKDMDSYLNVWEGHTRQMLDGAVYANELRKAQEENRIRDLIIDKSIPVQTFWDLGWADMTSIWFVQVIAGGEVRVIDFYQNCQKTIDHYAQVLQDKGYIYKDWWLPHDAENKNMTGKSVKDILQGMGKPVRITPKLSVADGINAARLLLDRAFIHSTNCADGLQNLRHYRYDVDPSTKMFSNKPLHDQHSHAADSWRYVAVALDEGHSSWGESINKPQKWIV
jgi:phage terminase large subunit